MIIPAIDLISGEAVRLLKGDYSQKTIYSKNPAELAKWFEMAGAKYLHVVDLDGAKSGASANTGTIREIREAVSIPIQVGGGIRTADTAARYLEDLKIDRVILGTAAIEEPGFVREMIAKYGTDRIVVGVDVRSGKVATSGWLQDSGADYLEFIGGLTKIGIKYIVATDISRDGALTSPNWAMYERIKEKYGDKINITVSGGVSCEADIRRARGYYGVIVGRAHYEGKVDLVKILAKRIVPCLDIKNGNVVKGIKFVGLRDIGNPVEIAKRYEQQGADEVVLLDISATEEERESMFPLLRRVSNELSIPVALGGGIRTIDDFRKAIECGASKVSVNSAAVANPQLISEAAAELGSERVVVAIDFDGRDVYVKGGHEKTGLDLISWAKTCEELGAGELLVTSIGGDGTKEGYDIAMTKAVVEAAAIPVIASGGCGSIRDILDVLMKTDCDAALAASLFHYGTATVSDVKSEMKRHGIPCRTM